jgi:hypothetical protein
MKACRERRVIAPLILNLSTRRRWVANFTPWPIYSGKEPWVGPRHLCVRDKGLQNATCKWIQRREINFYQAWKHARLQSWEMTIDRDGDYNEKYLCLQQCHREVCEIFRYPTRKWYETQNRLYFLVVSCILIDCNWWYLNFSRDWNYLLSPFQGISINIS